MFDAYWLPIGEGLLAVRKTVLRVLNMEEAGGGEYNHSFGRAIAGTPYELMEKTGRSALLFCMDHRDDLVEMRAAWTPEERTNVCHPKTMAKRLREFHSAGLDYKPKPKKPKKEEVKKKEAVIADLEERLAAAETNANPEPLFNLATSPPTEIARILLANAGVDRVKAIYQALGEAIASIEAFDAPNVVNTNANTNVDVEKTKAPKAKAKPKAKVEAAKVEVEVKSVDIDNDKAEAAIDKVDEMTEA
jgi:hypothetical protein